MVNKLRVVEGKERVGMSSLALLKLTELAPVMGAIGMAKVASDFIGTRKMKDLGKGLNKLEYTEDKTIYLKSKDMEARRDHFGKWLVKFYEGRREKDNIGLTGIEYDKEEDIYGNV